MERRRLTAVEVRPEVYEAFNRETEERLARQRLERGRLRQLVPRPERAQRVWWPGFTWRLWQRTRRFDTSEYLLEAGVIAAAASAGGAPVGQLVALGTVYFGGTLAVLGLVQAHRSRAHAGARPGRALLAGCVFRVPGWAALPVVVAVVGLFARDVRRPLGHRLPHRQRPRRRAARQPGPLAAAARDLHDVRRGHPRRRAWPTSATRPRRGCGSPRAGGCRSAASCWWAAWRSPWPRSASTTSGTASSART